jgi:hypothetical protein
MTLNNRHGKNIYVHFIQECTMPIGGTCQKIFWFHLDIVGSESSPRPAKSISLPSVTGMAPNQSSKVRPLCHWGFIILSAQSATYVIKIERSVSKRRMFGGRPRGSLSPRRPWCPNWKIWKCEETETIHRRKLSRHQVECVYPYTCHYRHPSIGPFIEQRIRNASTLRTNE